MIKDGKFRYYDMENVAMHADFSGLKSILKHNARSFPGYVTLTLLKG